MIETEFDEVKVSTLIDAFKIVQNLSVSLAKLYEEKASLHYSATSPEHLNRVKHDFIRAVGEVWKDDDEYNDVIIFPDVALNTKNIMTDTFKFNLKQIAEMDKVNDVDGRVALAYQTRMILLVIHLGFGELANPNLTLQGKTSGAKTDKLSSAEEQRTKDMREEEGANNFKNLVEAGEDKSDISDEEAFVKDVSKKKRAAKRKAAAQAKGAATLGGDTIEKVVLHMLSPERAEEIRFLEIIRKEEREDRLRLEERHFQLQMLQS